MQPSDQPFDGFVVRCGQAERVLESHDMNAASHVPPEPDLGWVNPNVVNSDVPDDGSTTDIDRKAARRFAYGIASVFSMMLILVVTVGVMLWAH